MSETKLSGAGPPGVAAGGDAFYFTTRLICANVTAGLAQTMEETELHRPFENDVEFALVSVLQTERSEVSGFSTV